jgi:hypothetical protein
MQPDRTYLLCAQPAQMSRNSRSAALTLPIAPSTPYLLIPHNHPWGHGCSLPCSSRSHARLKISDYAARVSHVSLRVVYASTSLHAGWHAPIKASTMHASGVCT